MVETGLASEVLSTPKSARTAEFTKPFTADEQKNGGQTKAAGSNQDKMGNHMTSISQRSRSHALPQLRQCRRPAERVKSAGKVVVANTELSADGICRPGDQRA